MFRFHRLAIDEAFRIREMGFDASGLSIDSFEMLVECRALSSLTAIGLGSDGVNASHLMPLICRLSELETVDLHGSKLSGVDLSQLKQLTMLRVLNLSSTDATDMTLKQVSNIPTLLQLNVSYTRVSAKAISDIERKIPMLKCIADGLVEERGRDSRPLCVPPGAGIGTIIRKLFCCLAVAPMIVVVPWIIPEVY
jgi:hypothetical protein